MIINIFQEGIQVLSELDLVEDVAADKANQETITLFHELNVLRDSRIRLLCPIVYKVYSEVVHIEIPKESLILFIFSDGEVHEHHKFLLLF